MNILAIETTAIPGSVAAARDGEVIRELSLPDSPRAAASLAPTIQELLRKTKWHTFQVELVAVSIGPGQFTSVRIGVVTAKMFAYAVGAEILGLNTFDVVAADVPPCAEYLAVIGDAQRGQAVGRAYRWHAQLGWMLSKDAGVVELPQWLARWQTAGSLVIAGPGLHRFAKLLQGQFAIAPPDLWNPTASGLARLAYRRYQAGERGDVWTLKPIYYRRSYAEEKREQRST